MEKQAVDGRAWNSRRDPDLTQREILDAAAKEFAEHGLDGARIDDIARGTNTSKRMIYYYFGSKEGLYRAVLHENYLRIRSLESGLKLSSLEPVEALKVLVRTTLEHYERNPDLARIVGVENLIMHGKVAESIEGFKKLNRSALETLEDILERGRESGEFRSGHGAPGALDVHQVLSALILNRVSNRYTFRVAFGRDMLSKNEGERMRSLIESTVLRLVLAEPAAVP